MKENVARRSRIYAHKKQTIRISCKPCRTRVDYIKCFVQAASYSFTSLFANNICAWPFLYNLIFLSKMLAVADALLLWSGNKSFSKSDSFGFFQVHESNGISFVVEKYGNVSQKARKCAKIAIFFHF